MLLNIFSSKSELHPTLFELCSKDNPVNYPLKMNSAKSLLW